MVRTLTRLCEGADIASGLSARFDFLEPLQIRLDFGECRRRYAAAEFSHGRLSRDAHHQVRQRGRSLPMHYIETYGPGD